MLAFLFAGLTNRHAATNHGAASVLQAGSEDINVASSFAEYDCCRTRNTHMRLFTAGLRMPREDLGLLIVVLLFVALFLVWAMPAAIFLNPPPWLPKPIPE